MDKRFKKMWKKKPGNKEEVFEEQEQGQTRKY